MSLAACEIATKLPGPHAAISLLMIALASPSSPTKCMTAISMTATGALKSKVSAAPAKIVSGSRKSASR